MKRVDTTCPFDVYEASDEMDTTVIEEVVDMDISTKETSKEEKFKNLAEKRVNTILRELRALTAMAYTYEGAYDKKMVESMMFTINKATEATRDSYSKKEFLKPTFSF